VAAGRELFAYGQDGMLKRIAEGKGGPKLMWATPMPTIAAIDACDGATLLVTAATATGTSLISISRETGKPTGSLDSVRGFWPARDGSERVNVRAGTLDDTSWLLPLAHYFMRSAQPWQRPAGDAACFATLPSETEILPLVNAWRELWQSE